jgi:homoserine dehydrogenase
MGVDALDAMDLGFARELGYRIKLLATAQLSDAGLELHVSPTLVRLGTPLAEVQDAYNAIRVVGDAVGPVFYHGLGAGQMPTASAVVADMIDTAVGRTRLTFQTLELFSVAEPPRVEPRSYDQLPGRYYLRMQVKDDPGVLASVTGALGAHGVSIASVIQHAATGAAGQRHVPLVVMTHEAAEGSAHAAAEKIQALESIIGTVLRLRVKDAE